ncbi:MAG: phage replisome organizer N-terminal domain-containing protein [Clostridiales bacterium]|nr:phage replisome organizer N-terminal domain-containing protein [Clostridiales bacterium]
MAGNKKYDFLRLEEDFFKTEEMMMLESMENGIEYELILLKMYLRSLKDNGRLMYRDGIPYTPEVLAALLRTNAETLKSAVKCFEQLQLIEILDNGAIFMTDFQKYVGGYKSEKSRERAYRERIRQERETMRRPASDGESHA